MAEEVLKYRVEIDQADLSSQLSGIKNQIDTALGSMAFNNAGTSAPLGNTLVSAAADFNDSVSSGMMAAQNSFGRASELLQGGLQSGRLGFQKFTGDLERSGLLTPPEYARELQFAEMSNRTYSSPTKGIVGSVLGAAFGMGYDWNQPYSRAEYMRQQGENAGNQIINSATNAIGIGGAIAGFTAGAGTLGAAVATPIGLASAAFWGVNALANTANYEEEAVANFGSLIEQTSVRNVGSLGRDESKSAARFVRGLSEDVNNRVKVGDAADIENLVTEGIAAGAFLDTGSVEQFKKRAKDLVENFREIQHTMKVSGEEAMAVIGSLTQGGMASNIKDAKNLIGMAASVGSDTGFTTKDMLQFASQGAEMVRGTGLDMGKAGKEAMGLIQEIRGGYGTVYDRSVLDHVGGTQQAAVALQQMNLNYGNSMPGRVMSAAIMNGYDITSMGTLGEIAMKAGEDIPVTYGGGLDWQIKQREFREDMSYWERSNVELAQIGAEFRAQGMDTFSKKQLEQKFINDYGMTVPMAKLKASNMLSDPMKRFEQELNTLAEMDNFVDNRIGKFGAISAQAGIAVRQWWNEGFGEAASDWVGGVRNMGYGVSNALSNDPLAGDARDFSDMVKTSDTLGAYFKREKDYAAASPEERAKMDQVEEARLNVQGVIGPDGTKRERTTIEMLEAINGDPSLVGKAAGFMLWQGGEYGLSSRTKDMKEARDALVASGIDEKTADTIKYSDVNDIVTKGTFRGDKLNGVQLRNIKSRLDSDLVIASENPRADEETRMQIDAEQYNDYRDKMVRKFYGKDSVIDSKYKLDKDNYSNWDMVGGWGIVEGAGAALQFLTGDLLPSVGEGNRRARDNKGRVRRMKEEYADREYDDSEEGKNQAKQDSFALQLLENAAGDDGDENLKLMEENPQLARETFERELKSVENYRELAENTDDKELKRLYLQQADDMEGLYAPLLEMANSEDFKAMEYHKQSVLAEQGERNLNKGIERYEANKEAFDKAGITPDTMEGKTFLATIGKVSDKLWDDNSKEVLKKGKTAKETVTLVDALVEQTEEEEDEQAKKDKEKYGDYQNAGLIKKATEGDGTGEGWFDSVKQTNTLLTHIYDQMITLTNSTVQTKDSEALRQKQNTPSINYRTTTS